MSEKTYLVVPVYKVEAYLDRCIQSILNQTCTSWELVLVDDGSPDSCPAICDRYAAEYENITVIHQANGGLSAARNAGIAHALKHGAPEKDWITFIDSDDFIHPKYLEYLYRAAKESGTEISICGYLKTSASEISGEDVEYICTVLTPEEFWRKDRTNALIACTKLYRLSLLGDIRFPQGKLHEDEFTTYKILFKSSSVAIMGAKLYYYYFNAASITHTEWSPRRLAGLDALEEQVDYFCQNGFPVACEISARHLLQHCIKHLMYIKHLSPKYDSHIREVKARRKRAFWLYAKKAGLKKAVSYWYEVRIQSPMRRVLGQESVVSFLIRRIKKKLHLQ